MLSKEFEVIEVEKRVPPQYLVIEPTKLRQTKGIVEALEFAPFVQYLLDSKHGRLAIRVAAEKDANRIRFAKKRPDESIHHPLSERQAGGPDPQLHERVG